MRTFLKPPQAVCARGARLWPASRTGRGIAQTLSLALRAATNSLTRSSALINQNADRANSQRWNWGFGAITFIRIQPSGRVSRITICQQVFFWVNSYKPLVRGIGVQASGESGHIHSCFRNRSLKPIILRSGATSSRHAHCIWIAPDTVYWCKLRPVSIRQTRTACGLLARVSGIRTFVAIHLCGMRKKYQQQER